MISNRLKSLTKYVDKNDHIIDVGCDHALLDIYLIENNFINSIIVSDIHENALNAGISNIKKRKLSKKIDARLGNGLEVLNDKDNIDTLLISGMGTSTILSIVNNDYFKNINKLILQSNNDHYLLRQEMTKLGFKIINEEYFMDNKKSYINIVFVRGNEKYSKLELIYGPILMHDKNYLEFELGNCLRIKNLMPNAKLKYKLKLNREIKLLNKLIKKASK